MKPRNTRTTRNLILPILFVYFVSFVVASAAHVQFNLADFISAPATNKVVRVTHTGPTISGTNIIPTLQFLYRSDTAGQLIISNMVAAHYDVQINASIWAVTSFGIDVPDTNIVLDASTLISTGATAQAWQTIADGRYVARSSGGATNLAIYGLHLFTTNVAGVVSVLPSAFTTIIVNATTNVTFTLPGTSFVSDGRIFRFKNVSTNSVTIDAAGSDLIDGAGDYTLTNRYDGIELQKESTNWWKWRF